MKNRIKIVSEKTDIDEQLELAVNEDRFEKEYLGTGEKKVYSDFFCEFRSSEIREPIGEGGSIYGDVGVHLPQDDFFAEYDDRYFDKNIMRFSSYFTMVRESRKNAELYTKTGIYPERYCAEHPLPFGGREIRCEAVITVCPEYKKVSLNNGIEIIVYNSDKSLFLRDVDSEMPEIFLMQNSFLATEEAPYYDFYISKGLVPDIMERILKICRFEDALTEDGGTLSVCYETLFHGGMVSKTTSFDIKVFKQTCAESEYVDTDNHAENIEKTEISENVAKSGENENGDKM